MKITITVNGREYTHEVEPRMSLAQYLRVVLRLTGTHRQCYKIVYSISGAGRRARGHHY